MYGGGWAEPSRPAQRGWRLPKSPCGHRVRMWTLHCQIVNRLKNLCLGTKHLLLKLNHRSFQMPCRQKENLLGLTLNTSHQLAGPLQWRNLFKAWPTCGRSQCGQGSRGWGLGSPDAPILRAPKCPHEAVRTPNLLLIIDTVITGPFLFMGYRARQFIIYIISLFLLSVR